ncbi:MAG TPA: DUF1028 domain-containing protein [Thermomicrobiales bacterium]|nr:DUF1028 domain-containing protein [Thermomicrobiales bacterium]
MTFSIAGRCARTGRFGIAVSSSSPAVAARCAHARAGAGAVASQNITDPALGPKLLAALAAGERAEEAMKTAVRDAPFIEYRQVTVVDRTGGTAFHNGAHVLGTNKVVQIQDAIAAGNLLSSPTVPDAMVAAFAADPNLDIGDRLVAAMQAGLVAGGEEGPVHSAGMVIVDQVAWPVTDLRVDWSEDPIGQLAALWRLWRPQEAAYLQRVLDPTIAPSYGVPGDR